MPLRMPAASEKSSLQDKRRLFYIEKVLFHRNRRSFRAAPEHLTLCTKEDTLSTVFA